jgi:hypothetical protein
VALLLAVISLCSGAIAQGTSLSVSPLPDASVRGEDLMISVSVSGPLVDALNLSQAKLFVDEREVTMQCLRTDRFLSYRPLSPPETGPVSARLEFPNGVERVWTFQILASQVIKSVTHSATDSLGEYEELVVTMEGEPGLKAGFLLGDKEKEYPMTEASRGVYIGSYTVSPGDFYLGEPVTGLLHVGSRVEKLQAKELVTLFGHLFRVVIFSPKSGSQTPKNFDIKGRTRPGCKVIFVPDLSFRPNTRAPNTQGRGAGGSFETRADDQGYFTVNYGVPLSLPNLSVVMAVFATTPEGERSVPVILRYHF